MRGGKPNITMNWGNYYYARPIRESSTPKSCPACRLKNIGEIENPFFIYTYTLLFFCYLCFEFVIPFGLLFCYSTFVNIQQMHTCALPRSYQPVLNYACLDVGSVPHILGLQGGLGTQKGPKGPESPRAKGPKDPETHAPRGPRADVPHAALWGPRGPMGPIEGAYRTRTSN